MNGISIEQLRSFHRWWFSQQPFVTADEADIDQHFFGFDYDEFMGGLNKNLTSAVAGLSMKTHTGLTGEVVNEVSQLADRMEVDVLLVKKCDVKSFSEQEAAYDACKSVLMDYITWMHNQRTQGLACDYPFLEQLRIEGFSHTKLGPVGDGFYGWKLHVIFVQSLNEDIEFDPITAPPVWDIPDGHIAIYRNGVGWTHEAPAAGGLTCDTLADCPTFQNEVEAREVADASLSAAIDALSDDLSDHLIDYANPHQTTLAQAVDASNEINDDIDANGHTVTGLAAPVLSSDAATKGYVDGLIDNTLKPAEAFTPAGSWPTTYGGNAVQNGDTFRVAAAGTVGSTTVNAEDLLIANVDSPGQTDSNWQVLESNRDQASESVKGVAKIATQAQVEDVNASNNENIVTPQKLWLAIAYMVTKAWTWTLQQTFTVAPKLSSVTAELPLFTNSTKEIIHKSLADFKTWLALTIADVTGLQTELNNRVETVWDGNATVTGVSALTLVSSKLIAANYFSSTDCLNIEVVAEKTGTSGSASWGMAINSSASTAGKTDFVTGANFTSSTLWNKFIRTFHFITDGGVVKLWGFVNAAGTTDIAASTGTPGRTTWDVTGSKYLIIWVTPTSATDSFLIHWRVTRTKAVA